MTVSIPKDLEDYVQSKVASGQCASQEALIAEALRVYRKIEESHAELRASVEEARRDHDRGDYVALKSEVEIRAFFDDIAALGRSQLDSASKA